MMQTKKKVQPQRGIALVLTLLVLVLLTTFMTEFFFETSLEIRTIQNFKSSFVAQSVAKSMFKATIAWLVQDDRSLFETLRNLYQLTGGDEEISILNPPTQLIEIPKEFLEDFGEATLFAPYVRPIDHLYNLNRLVGPDENREEGSEADQINFNEFVNLVKQILVEIPQDEDADTPPEYRQLDILEITPLYANIFDYLDKKNNDTRYFAYGVLGSEDSKYLEFEGNLEIPVKNRKLDRLTEIRLINNILESGIPYEEWKKHFTIYDVGLGTSDPGYQGRFNTGEVENRLNINLATYDEIVDYLGRFNTRSPYYEGLGITPSIQQSDLQEYIDEADTIAEILVSSDENDRRIEFSDFSGVEGALESLGLPFHSKRFFILHSQWFEIRLVAEANGIQSEIQATVQIPKDEDGNPTGKPIIHDFIIR